MITFLKHRLIHNTKIKKLYNSLQWGKHIFSDWFNTYIFKKTILFDTPFGFKMISRNYLANRMMMNGSFETAEIELIKETLSNTNVFVDVGANIGLYTCLAGSLGKHVIAVEPQAQNLECLCANINNNGWQNIEVFPIGLSHKPDLLTLYGASGPSASLVKGWAGYSPQFNKTIPVNTLDNVLSNRFQGKKIFIKIDVEGAEYDVLKGALNTLAMSPRPTWFIEICLNEFHPGELNKNYAATFELFWQHSYEARLANKEGRVVTPIDIKNWVTRGNTDTNEFNYVFIPK